MSTNIHFKATRKIQVVETGQIEDQTAFFENVWQTPTDITHAIQFDANPIQAYKNWVMLDSEDSLEDIFDEDDIFCEGPAVDQRIVNYEIKHCAEFDEWIKNVTARGFKITAESW